jgi:protein TonB
MRLPDHREFETSLTALEDRIRRMDSRRLIFAFAGALVLHASTGIAFISWSPEPVTPPGEMVITIDLAPAVASAATEPIAGETAQSAPQQVSPPEPEPVEQEELVEEIKPDPLPPEEVPKPIEPEPETVKQEAIEPPPPAEKAEVVVAPAKPKPKPKPKAKLKPTPPAPAQAARSASTQRADIGGSGARASPSDIAKYIGRLRAALERNKRYPASAGGASGTASLRFTVNRAGAVTSYTLTRSSGNAALDAATRAMVQGANLPPIPEDLPGSITVGVPVNFRVR